MKCEICVDHEHKYTCPGCDMKTCSLRCCKEHKLTKNCNGIRDKTKFVKLTEFSEKELISDYSFLEEQARLIDSTRRDNLKRRHSDTTPSMDYLRKLAFQKYSIYLKFMPKNSTKRQNNKTRFDKTDRSILWHLEFDINGNLFTFDELVKPDITLNEVLMKFYEKNEFKLVQLDESFRKLNDLNLLFEIRDFKLKEKYFIKFDLNLSLNENLNRKHIIEYPILKIVPNNKICLYKLREDNINKKDNVNNDELEDGELEDGEEEQENEDYINEIDQNDENIFTKKVKLDDFEAILNNPMYNSFESGVKIEKL
jgi:hypothetical protein